MARAIKDIQAEIIAAKTASTSLAGLDSTSQTAIWLLWTYVIAVCIYTLENLFDAHLADVKDALATDKSHTLRWYQNKALNYQYGSALPDGEDVYDNSLLTQDQIDTQKIIAQAAAVEDNGIVTIKVAKADVDGELVPLAGGEYDAFSSYMQDLKDAGVYLQPISFDGDKLKLLLDIEYDPQILTADGARVDGSDPAPVESAIKTYLKNLPFNGLFRIDKLVDALQAVDGVIIPTVLQAQAAKYDVTSFQFVNIQYQPYSGYLRLFNDGDLVVNYNPVI